MSKRIGNMLVFVLIFLMCGISMQMGCDDRGVDGSENVSSTELEKKSDRYSQEFYTNLDRRMQQTETTLEPYRNNGLVKVTVEPSGGDIYVDDGLVSIPEKGLMLPIGTYTFKALWPDGSEISKRVFVTPALQQAISWKWSGSRNVSGGSGNKQSDIEFDAPLSLTNVILTKN